MRLVGLAGSVAVIAFALFVAKPGSTYRVAPLFLVPIVWLPYLFRGWLRLHPLHYVLFIVAILLHNLGAMGWYLKGPLPFSFDILVHFYFGVVGGLLVYRMLQQSLPLRGWTLGLMTVLLVLGAGAVHEEVEWFSTLLLGPEKGMLKTPAQGVYIFDTQRDMFNDLAGSILAVAIYALYQRGRRTRPAEPSTGDLADARTEALAPAPTRA